MPVTFSIKKNMIESVSIAKSTLHFCFVCNPAKFSIKIETDDLILSPSTEVLLSHLFFLLVIMEGAVGHGMPFIPNMPIAVTCHPLHLHKVRIFLLNTGSFPLMGVMLVWKQQQAVFMLH